MKKQYSLIIVISIITFFGFYFTNFKHADNTPINSGSIPHRTSLENKKAETETFGSSSNNSNSLSRTYYSTIKSEKIIGTVSDGNSSTSLNQTFQVFVDKFTSKQYSVWLEYELYGLADYTSVCKSVNDQIATGGSFVKKQAAWSKQRELIQPGQVREGRNIVRFNAPENGGYSYKVRNVSLKIEPVEASQTRMLTVNQPGTCTYYQKFGYIQGFVTGKGSEKAKLAVNGKPLQAVNGLFENIVEKENSVGDIWSATVTAQFEDGEKITQKVFFNKSEQYDYTNNLISPIRRSETEFSANAAINLQHDGISIQGETESFADNISISATTLRAIDMASMGSGMVNVTGQGNGYRMLPHVSKFQKNLILRIKYDTTMLPVGYKPQDIRTYYFDETANNWIVLPLDTIDIANHEIVSYTNHFTDFINAVIKAPELPETQAFTPTSIKDLKAANPLEGYNIINPPSANNMGTANLNFPIEVPAGRLGMQPNLAITYGSGGGNSWLGVGWNLSISAITVETRWGVPKYDQGMESESYLLNGEELVPEVQRTGDVARTTDKQFYLKVEGAFSKIIRHGSSPGTYYWTVTDKNGVESTYGDVKDSSCLYGGSGIAYWALTKVKDVTGNFVSYEYQIMYHRGVDNGINYGCQIYPKKIRYTNFNNAKDGKYWIDFNLEDISVVLRPDIQISGRLGFKEVTAHRLKNIVVNSNWGIIRKYHMVYKTGAFDKTLLCSIVEEDAKSSTINGTIGGDYLSCGTQGKFSSIVGLKQHRFEYFDNVPAEKYTAKQTIEAENDNLKDRTLFGKPSAINNTRSWEWGFGVAAGEGLGYATWKNNITMCGRYGRTGVYSNGLSMLMDIDGDGLPDKVMYNTKFDLLHLKTDKEVSYRKLVRNDGTYLFDTNKKTISGITDLFHEKSLTNSVGLDFHVGITDKWAINLAGGFSRTNSYTSKYFCDANGDGLIDFVDGGEVFYNKSSNENITFGKYLSDTVWIGEGQCNYIINSGRIDSNIFVEDPIVTFCDTIHRWPLKDTVVCYDNSNLHEAVRLWIAPRTGNISINSPIKLIEDTSYNRLQMHYVDGVKYRLQKNGVELYNDSIAQDDYNTKNLDYYNLPVNRGDRIYFRLQSKKNIQFDNVMWSPTIYYVGKDTNIIDADSKPINLFRAHDDFLLSAKQEIGMPLQGTVKIRGTINAPPLSDTVRFQIRKNNNIIYENVFFDSTGIDFSYENILPVDSEDVFVFYLKSNTQVQWSAINSSFEMFYTETTDPDFVIDTNSVYRSLKYKPILQYSLYQEDILSSVPYTLQSGTYSVMPNLTFLTTNTNGRIVFAVKKNNKILAKKILTIQNGAIQNNTSIPFANPSPGTVYYEYYADSISLANSINYATANLSPGYHLLQAGLHATVNDSMFIFGNLYRKWGQFCYKPEEKIPPIDESKLNIANTIDTNVLINMDTANLSFEHIVANVKYLNIYNPLTSVFSMMYPNMDSLVWQGVNGYTMAGSSVMSNETNMKSGPTMPDDSTDISETTVLYDSPIVGFVSGQRITAPLKYSYTDNFNCSKAIGPTILKIGSCSTISKTYQITDFLDMNGDRYPDVVGKWGIQYTTPQGGLSPAYTENIFNDDMSIGALSVGATAGTTFPLNKNSSSGLDEGKGLAVSGVAGVSGILGTSTIKHTFFDINGDGLPDIVNDIDDKNKVDLNLGYKFANTEDWASDGSRSRINTSECLNINIGAQVGPVLESFGTIKDAVSQATSGGGGDSSSATGSSKWEFSLALGFGFTFSTDRTKFLFIDINGDGLQDKVSWVHDGDNRIINVALNTGSGFKAVTQWASFEIKDKDNATYNQSVDLSGTAGYMFMPIPLLIAKIIGTASGHLGTSVNITRAQFIDMDNDGYVDLVTSDGEDDFHVYYSTLNKVNLLKTVYTPTNKNFTMDYALSECSQKSPSRNWQLASVGVFDGHVGDGADNMYSTFEYKNPYYDRFERSSFGCDTVITSLRDTRNNNAVYRTVTEAYHNNDYLFKGLKKYEVLKDANNQKYLETVYTYTNKRISTGEEVPDSLFHCFGDYYPAISVEDKYFYEGASSYTIHTQKRYTHGTYGNIVEYQDLGDVADGSDDVRARITYDSIPSIYVMALAKNISVYHGTDLLRSRDADYDGLGELASITLNHDGLNSVTTYSHNNYGSIESVTQPEDYNGDHKELSFTYDTLVNTYPVSVSDESSYHSSINYNYKFGKPIYITDVAGNTMYYKYYADGRIQTISAPYEAANSIPYTLKFEYWDNRSHLWGDADNVPWARTLHYDPANANNLISTVSFTDGMGRGLQTKKKSTVNGLEKIVVSGKTVYDAFGRADSTWYPIMEGLNTDSIFNPGIDTLPPTVTVYDVLDRALTVTAPDQTATSMSYGFGTDKFGATRFKTLQTDALNNVTQQFKDARGLQTTVIDALNGYTAFVYNPLGELLSSIDPEDNQTTYQYDGLGRKIQTVHPDAGTSSFVYDEANNLISMQTQNLINESAQINYVYSYNKLKEIHYPDHSPMDVYYEYGDHNAGNNAGRITKQQDASGTQTFEYGKLGELIGNIHTFVVPGGITYTFAMNWTYDSWNRLRNMTYPDGEVVNYSYNLGGQLYSVRGTKTTRTYNYINSMIYNKFGNRLTVNYGNGTGTKYIYNPTTLRLSNLRSYNSQGEQMQNISYTYDNVSNITQIRNTAPVMANGLGGTSVYDYTYDHLYRLDNATGSWDRNTFSLDMQYSASGNITEKTQYAETSINGTLATINYDRAYNYTTTQPHAVQQINNNDLIFNWDANGNMTFHQDNGKIPLKRHQCWDEENRLIAVNDEKYLSNYVYDAAGERVWKLGGKVQQMLINGEQYVNFADMNENKTLYANPYMVVNDKEYTKHYYIEGQRIASKIGAGLSPAIVPFYEEVKTITQDEYGFVRDRLLKMCQVADDCVGFYSEYTYYGKEFKCIKPLIEQDKEEKDLYFYHSDHIGSSSFITDNDGYASQHLLFLPFGEIFSEQRSTANYYTPYKFSGKEKDEETSYSYFGARYYLSDISVWASVDPLVEKYPNTSPYMYCAGNPVLLVDPDGKEWIITGSKSKEAFNRYQSATSLKLSMDPSGKVHVVGSPWIVWRRSDRMLKRMINDQGATVHLIANDNNMTSAGISSRSGGAYMGNTVTKDASGKVQHVDAYQEINEPLLEKIEGEIGNAGVLIKHEAFEAFMGALMAEKSGISSPNASVATSTYNDAHNKANRYAYGNIKIIDIPTITLRANTDPATRSIMPYTVVNSTKKVYRSDD